MSFRLIHKVFLILFLWFPSQASAQVAETANCLSKYSVQIDLNKTYVGGVCIIKSNASIVNASIVNEFGVSIITFQYEPNKGKIKIVNGIKQLKRPFIKKVLKKDFKSILTEHLTLDNKQRQPIQHVNSKHNITYNLIPL